MATRLNTPPDQNHKNISEVLLKPLARRTPWILSPRTETPDVLLGHTAERGGEGDYGREGPRKMDKGERGKHREIKQNVLSFLLLPSLSLTLSSNSLERGSSYGLDVCILMCVFLSVCVCVCVCLECVARFVNVTPGKSVCVCR